MTSSQEPTIVAEVQPQPGWKDKEWWRVRGLKLQAWVVENYLPLAFAVALTFALAYPVPGKFLVEIVVLDNVHIIQEINMIIVFFISGLVLNTTELRLALQRRNMWIVVYGFLAILVWTPCLGFAMREIPLEPKTFSIGLTIFCVVPTTLGIGVALVRSCKGNEAIALLLTVATNMLGVFTMPPEIKLLFINFDTQGLHLALDIPELLGKLTVTILVPSLLGKALRDLFKPVEAFAKKYRTPLSLFSTTNLAFIVWQTLSGARDTLLEQRFTMILAVIALSAGVHVFYLIVNWVIVWFIFQRPPIKEAVSVIIMSSQKSAPVAVTVISYITTVPAQQGLLAIPCIVGQLSQIFIGSLLAKFVAPLVVRKTKEEELAAKARHEAAAAALENSLSLELPDIADAGAKVEVECEGKEGAEAAGAAKAVEGGDGSLQPGCSSSSPALSSERDASRQLELAGADMEAGLVPERAHSGVRDGDGGAPAVTGGGGS